jgi:hypothetical protein
MQRITQRFLQASRSAISPVVIPFLPNCESLDGRHSEEPLVALRSLGFIGNPFNDARGGKIKVLLASGRIP